jgi:ribosomal RNA methyltransferase Nop2
MGRRAKNKQAPPEPLEKKEWTSPKKLGKRKAETVTDLDDKARPTKKSRDSTGNVKSKSKPKSSKATPRVKQNADDGSSDGWEGVQDEGVV